MDEKTAIFQPPNYVFGFRGICTYCGQDSSDLDHVIPVSWWTSQDRSLISHKSKGIRTYSCSECNSILSSFFFEKFKGRCDFVAQRLQSKLRNVVKFPDWHEDDIIKMGKNVKSGIIRKIHNKKIALSRLNWQHGIDFQQIIKDSKDAFCDKESVLYRDWLNVYFE